MPQFEDKTYPSFLYLQNSGELPRRLRALTELLNPCALCPRKCMVNRLKDETGFCRTGSRPWLSNYMPHFGEEAPISGEKGSGAIFFTHCNLACVFCQTYEISQGGEGEEVEVQRLADIMLELQYHSCHNINLITPTHVVPQIVEALEIAIIKGLKIPLVYNSSGYESLDTLKHLDGMVDIYMPDFKIWDAGITQEILGVSDYPFITGEAIREMHRQVGDLSLDQDGLAVRGLLVRHLVLPDNMAGSEEVFAFLVREVSPHTYVNIMGHYHPSGLASKNPLLNRNITRDEYKRACDWAKEAGLYRLDETHRPLLELILKGAH